MWQRLDEALGCLEKDDAVRVVVLTGAGKEAFVSGADISQFDAQRASTEAQREYDKRTHAGRERLARFLKPTIARIRGYCLGGGAVARRGNLGSTFLRGWGRLGEVMG